jgi:hypothetical protein
MGHNRDHDDQLIDPMRLFSVVARQSQIIVIATA